MNIDDPTIKEARELACLFGNGKTAECCTKPWQIGENYLIRTVTMIQLGRLDYVGDKDG